MPNTSARAAAQVQTAIPLCVDLDGTLVKSDTLYDSALAVARHHPSALINIPAWLLQGKAALKRNLANTIQLDVVHLPYNRELLQYLEQQRATGRPLYLATAADADTANRIAAHLGIFTGVLASDGQLNLSGKNKLAAFQSRFGDNFSYIGNALPDLSLLQFGDPDRLHTFGFEDPDILITDYVTFGQKLFAAGPENCAAQDPSGGRFHVNCLRSHAGLTRNRIIYLRFLYPVKILHPGPER